uniref:Sec3-PIP2_bind domain-containing protein n=1 Tax=Trichuris muris TaxID=70415 RepID=A0A5S6QN64_TRIMR
MVSYFHPVTPRLHEVFLNEKSQRFALFHSWLLSEVRVVDGINPRKAMADLEITIDSVYRWEVCKVSEKESFIRQLWKVCHRYLLSQRPEFVNISIPVDEIESGRLKENSSLAATSSNIDSLAILDKTNMQTIVGSERQIAELLNHIDQLLTESNKVENVLDTYDQILAHVKHGVEMMEVKAVLLGVCSNNRQRLTVELRDFLVALMSCDFADWLSVFTGARSGNVDDDVVPAKLKRLSRKTAHSARARHVLVPAVFDHT